MWKYERAFTAVTMAIVIFISVCTQITQPETKQSQFADELIRLHVIANSDSPEDQALKLKVRDQLLLNFGKDFSETQTMEQARETIEANLSELEKVALHEIKRQGYNYPVKAQLGVWPFPTRVYGDEVYPAGEYEALRIVIGEGKGANWWCVMFPPLCFVDVSSSTAERPEPDDLYQTEQKESVTEEQETIVYTFKAVELWKSFKEWVDNIFT